MTPFLSSPTTHSWVFQFRDGSQGGRSKGDNGIYAWAVHDGDVSQAIIYSCVGFEPPMDSGAVKVQKKRALPLKAQLLDGNGIRVTDAELSAPPALQVLYTSSAGGVAQDITEDALAVGLGTEGNQFEFNVNKWQYNLKTDNYTGPGTYTMTMASGDSYVINPTCVASFIVE